MSYTDKTRWEDMNKILYSQYYSALSGKQHGTGVMTEKDFLTDKINLAEQMFSILGGQDSTFLKILFTADSLASAPYGFGGRKALQEVYHYDKNQIVRKIAQELQLSDDLIKSLDRSSADEKSLEVILLQKLGDSVENLDRLTPEIKQEFLACASRGRISKSFMQQLRETPVSSEQATIMETQASDMHYAISKLGEGQKKNPLKFLLKTKESDLAQQRPTQGIEND